MKKFDFNNNYINFADGIAELSNNNEPKNSNFDLTKLLQILPKLNLKQILNSQQLSQPQIQPQSQNNNNSFDIMRNENKLYALKQIQKHTQTVAQLKNSSNP